MIKVSKSFFLISYFLILSIFWYERVGYCEEGEDIIVLLYNDKREVSLYNVSNLLLTDITNNNMTIVVDSAPNNIVNIASSPNGLILNSREIGSSMLEVKDISKDEVEFLGNKYRGRLLIRAERDNTLIVTNQVGVEDYLKGVLSKEISPSWPMDALKAQAIVARTYALTERLKNKDKIYHIRDNIMNQVYGGKGSETETTTMAVDLTKNEVIYYKDNIATVFYHSICGGHTEDARNVWSDVNFPYLRGVRCNYDKDAPGYNWDFRISLEDVNSIIPGEGDKDEIVKVKLTKVTPRGRVLSLGFIKRYGHSLIITANELRRLLSYNKIKSTWFNIRRYGGELVFKGKGVGHGVGLCQWGARGMALKGYNFKDIIRHYFPNTYIKQLVSQRQEGMEASIPLDGYQ